MKILGMDIASNEQPDSTVIMFCHPYGVIESNNTMVSSEVLLKAYKEKIGTKVESNSKFTKDFIITEVYDDTVNKRIMIKCHRL